MTSAISALRKRWLALAGFAVLAAITLTAGTLFAANERQQSGEAAPIEQSVTGDMDPGLTANQTAAVANAQPPETGPKPDPEQAAPNSHGSDALTTWLAEQPETMGFITQEDAMTSDPQTMDWLLYQAVHKGVLTQGEADAIQEWYDRRPSTEEAPELLDHQPVYLDRPDDRDIALEHLQETDAR